MKNIHKYENQLRSLMSKMGRGYEETPNLNYGYIQALLTNKLISEYEAEILEQVYVVENNKYDKYYITTTGELGERMDDDI